MGFKLYPKIRKLPTILGIIILLASIGATTYLTKNVQQFFSKAETSITPVNIQTSNLTDTSFSVSWISPDNPSSGYIKYGKTASLGKIGLDDRDSNVNNISQNIVHHITLNNLDPQSTYYYKIVSQGKDFDNNGSLYAVSTARSNYPSSSLKPTYGTILESEGQVANEGIIYVRIANSNLISSLIKPSGSWLISMNSLSSQDFKEVPKIKPDDYEEIFIQGKQKSSKVMVSLKNNAPVPQIILGQDYDWRNAPSPTPMVPLKNTPVPTPGFNLSNPASGAAIPGQPLFRGTAPPGKPVQIQVESKTSFKGEVVTDEAGNWSWQIPENLPPGEHTVTVTSTDNQGNLQTIIRKFIILASGVQVAEAATPSATPTITVRPSPTPSPIPTVKPSPSPTPMPLISPTRIPTQTPTPKPSPLPTPTFTLTPSPKATSSPPTTGDLLSTIILAISGIFFVSVGFVLLKQPHKLRDH